MTVDSDAVGKHYDRGGSEEGLLSAVSAFVDALDPPITIDKLALLDQFHVGGLTATRALAGFAGISIGSHVVDVGAGLGGPARFLAAHFGCRVSGVDLSSSFVSIARLLSQRSGFADRTDFRTGDACAMPFPDAGFDLAWTQHAAMNIANRSGLYAECRRMLHAGGRLAIYDIVESDAPKPLHFPVPWAESDAASFLLDWHATRARIEASGFSLFKHMDVTDEARIWLGAPRPPAMFSLANVMGVEFAEMAANLTRNIREGRVRLVMAVFQALPL